MADDFQIKITTTGDPKGAEQVAAALGKVTKATTDNTKETRSLTQDVTSLGSRQNATKDVLEGLDSALKGNAMSMFGVAKAAKNLWEIFTVSTPAGRALQLAMVAVGTAAQFMGKETDKAGESATASTKDIDAMREAAESFNKVRFDTLNAQLDALKAKTESSLSFFKRLADLSKQLDDASMSLELAQLNGDPSLSADQKSARGQAIRDRYGRQAIKRDEGAREQEINTLRASASGTRSIAESAEGQRAMDAFLVSGLQANRGALKEKLNALYDQLAAEQAQIDAKGGLNTGANKAAFDRYQSVAAPLLSQAGAAFSPTADAYLKTLQERLKASEADAAAKKKEADAAQRKLDDALRLAPFEERTGRELSALGRRERYTAAGLDEPTQRRPGEAVGRLGPESPVVDSFSLMQMAREQGKTTGQVLAELTQAAIRENNERLTEEYANRLRRTQN